MEKVEAHYRRGNEQALERYYDVAAATGGAFGFLSPVNWPKWLDGAAEWMCSAQTVAEVGSGYGELVERCLSRGSTTLQTYYLLDVSQAMLDQACQRAARQRSNVRIRCIKWNMSGHSVPEIAPNSVERVAVINVLQDVNPGLALHNIHRLLRPQGQLRATFIRRETQDVFWAEDADYDVSEGRLYNFSALHDDAGISPLGYVLVNGLDKPFYRVQSYFTESEVQSLLVETGFALRSINLLTFPTEMVMERWSSELHRTLLSEKQKKLLEQWKGFPDAYDVVAERI